MGLRHNSSVCDAALMALVETDKFFSKGSLCAATIFAYYRLRSDIWLLIQGRPSLRSRFSVTPPGMCSE